MIGRSQLGATIACARLDTIKPAVIKKERFFIATSPHNFVRPLRANGRRELQRLYHGESCVNGAREAPTERCRRGTRAIVSTGLRLLSSLPGEPMRPHARRLLLLG